MEQQQRAHLRRAPGTRELGGKSQPPVIVPTLEPIMTSNAQDPLFPRVICLTLPDQRERQLAVVQQFEKVGIRNYEFYPGFSPDSQAVRSAYEEGRVKRYPDCFRCGKRDCGNPDCNNVLLPVQVAVALGFQGILRAVANSDEPYAAICEDDIVFADYAKDLFASDEFHQLILSSGLLGAPPALLRLTRPGIEPDVFFSKEIDLQTATILKDEVVMSNPFFLANRAFARLACERLDRIDHTADVIIHMNLMEQARCYTLNAQPVADRSWGLADAPSLIHPKAQHLDYLCKRFGESSPQATQEAKRIQNHLKKASSVSYCFTGSPRCGSHYVSAFLRKNGLDIGHEQLGRDGICAWQFAASSDSYPYISNRQASSDFFVHADHWFLYARNPISAIPSLIVENQKAPLSYAFRRDAIYEDSGVNLDDFAAPVERAARAYAHWYLLALKRKPKAVLRVENFLEDCRLHIGGHEFQDVALEASERGSGKPYLRVIHAPVPLADDWMETMPKSTLAILGDVATSLGYSLWPRGPREGRQ